MAKKRSKVTGGLAAWIEANVELPQRLQVAVGPGNDVFVRLALLLLFWSR
jgi:hypothetical protein